MSKYVENAERKNLTPPEMNAQSHTDVQTVMEITQYIQESVKNENGLCVKYIRNIPFPGSTSDGGSYKQRKNMFKQYPLQEIHKKNTKHLSNDCYNRDRRIEGTF